MFRAATQNDSAGRKRAGDAGNSSAVMPAGSSPAMTIDVQCGSISR